MSSIGLVFVPGKALCELSWSEFIVSNHESILDLPHHGVCMSCEGAKLLGAKLHIQKSDYKIIE